MAEVEIHGRLAPGFEPVREALAQSLAAGEEIGVRVSAVRAGQVVVDLWAGSADTAGTLAFGPETLVPVYSVTKALTALMIARLVDADRLDYAQTVASVWPEFAQAGKERVTIGQLMSHQAGLPGFVPEAPPEIWFDTQAVLDRLAAQAPLWPPGTAAGYHPITVGYMAGEVFRRVDGRSLGRALREDLALPLDLDLWIGLPDAEHGRVAQMKKPTRPADLGPLDAIKRSAFLDKGSAPGGRGSADWRRMEIPSANGHATALSLARLMGGLADGGRLDGTPLLSMATLQRMTAEQVVGQDRVLPFRIGWAAGLMRNGALKVYGPGPDSVGHSGWGGACAFADPDTGVGFAYTPTRQSHHLIGDPRALRLISALYAAL